MINKFQNFSGIKAIASISGTHLLLVYSFARTGRFPSYVHCGGVFYKYQCSFVRGHEVDVIYIPTDLNLPTLLSLSNSLSKDLYIEYVNEQLL